MRRIALINQKGGVGKTTITTNLGHALALAGQRVTVIDLDPQGQLASSYGIFRAPTKGIDQVLLNGADPCSVKLGIRDMLTLIPAGARLQEIEYLHDGGASRARLLQQALQGMIDDQAFVLFDCPPSSGLLVANAIFAADEALIPVSGDHMSLNGLAKMLVTIKKFEPYLEKSIRQWIGLNRSFPRRRLAKEVEDKLRKHFPEQLLNTQIREAAVIAECPGIGRTIFEYKPGSQSAKEFQALASELLERYEG
ncbi:MAG: ParA family protein [Candidatus Thiodiazotropha sp. (ex Lucinoma borealis)]|nr:ParA family protein [Candidatus Thiodiazotropha sp. (ex Lucinoma borealis)]MCU7857938.1 ParA family protein [Candidatus Thiodiazotropha sp. (ex Lucinoma borealis)]MCU7866781.1 ParA family protein [Candidatus Thiodiazotropha sp. (ex Lucinoma borealis)]MCU7870856.1 ParA family protein [Candidatus Thiodiazotropha sp. (ex Lucinoma borealis)]